VIRRCERVFVLQLERVHIKLPHLRKQIKTQIAVGHILENFSFGKYILLADKQLGDLPCGSRLNVGIVHAGALVFQSPILHDKRTLRRADETPALRHTITIKQAVTIRFEGDLYAKKEPEKYLYRPCA